jgi:PAS domain S-box-containing protein
MVYGAAVAATAAAALLRLALNPLIGENAVPFITFFPAVLFIAWYGGFRAGALGIVLSAVAADYYFVEPVHSFAIRSSADQVTLTVFIVVGFGIALLSHSQTRAVERADQAEIAERAQRQRFETTLASIGDGVIATDSNGRINFMNEVAEALTGWKREEASGRALDSIFQIMNEETRRPAKNPALHTMQQGRIAGLANHTVLIAKDGTEIAIDDSGSPIRGPNEEILGAVLIFRDIRERRRAEKERETLAEQSRMLNSGFDAIIVRDMQDRITSWNRVAEELYGWTAGEARGQDVHSLLKTVFPKPLDEIMRDLHRDNRWEGELMHTSRDGRTVTVLSHWILDRNSQGAPRSILQINVDMSARKRAEEEVREQRELLRVTLSSIGDAVIATDKAGVVTFLNPVAESLTGWKQEEAAGQPLERIFHIVNEQTRREAENPALSAMREGTIVGLANHTVLIARGGTEIPIDDAGSPIRDADGNTVGAVLIFRDVTERRRIERAQEEANRAKDNFLAMVSHELRNPLSAILGWAAILKKGDTPAERTAQAYDVIEKNALAEARLVESLLDLSRIAAGQLKLDSERVDLPALLSSAIDSVRPAAHAKGINLEIATPQDAALIGDSSRLQQIFSNLLTNAIKFTPRGGRIQVRLTRTGSHARIQVIDNGDGIDADFLPHIFERFRQADSTKSRTHGGLGLGLAIVHELVQAHGGTVTAESPGKEHGSTFTVTLPVPAVIPPHIEAAGPRLLNTDEVSISGLRILVVDDDADARELVGMTLGSRGAAVQFASSAAEALRLIGRDRPDVMIADIGMPDEDGYVLIQALRALEREHSHARLPAIALTAYASAADRGQALAAGYDLHLAKPVGPSDLMTQVQFAAKRLRPLR